MLLLQPAHIGVAQEIRQHLLGIGDQLLLLGLRLSRGGEQSEETAAARAMPALRKNRFNMEGLLESVRGREQSGA